MNEGTMNTQPGAPKSVVAAPRSDGRTCRQPSGRLFIPRKILVTAAIIIASMIVAYATTPDHKPEVSNNGENDPLHNRSMVAERDAGAMDSLAAHIRKFPRSGGVRGPAIGGRRNGPDRSQGGRRTMRRMFRVTAYCPCKICCGAHSDGVTASGRPVEYNGGRFVAADKAIAFGTMLSIPGYAGGRPVPVADRGGKIKGARLDVYFPTHAQAREFGDRENVLVEIQERTKDK